MSCKSAIYALNSAVQTLAVGGTINFGSIVRRYGCNCGLNGGNVTLNGTGYYDIAASFNITGTAAGPVTISLLKDGVAIPGGSATITTAVGSQYHVNIPVVVREQCPCGSTITAVVSGTAAEVDIATIIATKL